jgi:lipid II isoglutaminyl synthase (glutamine-hydrolysing)
LLAICGGYQLLGEEFVDGNGNTMKGLGVFPVNTKSLDAKMSSRCIGNIVVESQLTKSKLVGFENHGGQTYFTTDDAQPLGTVLVGYGNNFRGKTEGCVYKNAVGSYLHGSCLPKNPELCKWFVDQACEVKKQNNQIGYGLYYMIKKAKIDNSIGLLTKQKLIDRFL